ncbi:pyridoxal phosphate-dependent transferase [Neurospora tetraspora]|uniref:Pyridoxal phosphate-dependent transferase n=1 Tax=Neurospora tetraspora TaxID=94610 RepID=A0AAE0J145_9PEZI|nr:pyridoxal phosphate-dependent transferase [Neurospora tetraspora]
MTVKPITTPLGHSLPPHTPHAITTHLPGWDTALRLRDGDPELGKQLKSMYPRFSPLSLVKDLCTKILTHLSTTSPSSAPGISPSTHGCLPFTTPDAFPLSAAHCISHHRPAEHRYSESDASALQFRVVDFFDVPLIPNNASVPADAAALTEKVRLYLVIYPLKKSKGVMGVWTNPGVGISTRLAEVLLPLVPLPVEGSSSPETSSQFKVLEWTATGSDFVSGSGSGILTEKDIPKPTYLPESPAHQALRERIVALCQRLPVNPAIASRLTPNDIFLYTTGMAAVFRLQEALFKSGRRGPVVALGAVFHSTFHLFEEVEPTEGEEGEEEVEGFKHFGECEDSDKVMDQLEEYARGLREKGRGVGYLFVEFPSNPLLVSVDLGRLRKIADEYDFPVVVDDTVGSFCNIDVLPVADVVVTSLTKTFSGYADVMAGSILLSPSSRYHPLLSSTLNTSHHNTLSPPDAAHLLSNSSSYLARSQAHNLNAQMLASLLHTYSTTHQSPRVISRVLYPSFSPSASSPQTAYYLHHMRSGTAPAPSGPPYDEMEGNDSFTPGFGCLLSIDFPSKRVAKAFYDHLHVHQGPHLGAHLTIALPFNDLLWGAEESVRKYHAGYGAVPEQVRVSVGLEEWEELREVFEEALGWAEEEAVKEAAAEEEGKEGKEGEE